MNNNEKFEKFRKLRKLFREYEAIKAEKNRRIDEIQKLLVPGELKEKYVKEYKAVVDPKIEKVEDDVFRLIDDGAITFVTNREDAIRYRSEKRDDVLIFRGCGIDGTRILKRGVIEDVHTICGSKSCLRHACPLFGSPHCTTILKMYMAGKYDVMVNIKEE